VPQCCRGGNLIANGPRKIVVIDDDRSMLELIALHLRNAGYQVFAAEDVVLGGEAILRESPDVILCDIEMPYMSGDQFVAALKTDEATRDIPVVFVSVRDDAHEYASKLGAVAYLRKPFTVDRLLQVVGLYA
jgi:two-component system cell cycle response regulator